MAISLDYANTIVNPKAYAELAPLDAAFTHLRNEQPFDVATPDGYDPFWVACKHADILNIERQADLFHNGDRCSTLMTKDAVSMAEAFTGGETNLVRSLVAVDGAEHKALRAISFPAFTPKALQTLSEEIRTMARGFVQLMLSKGPQCDFANDVAFLYPLRVVMRVLGVPQEDEPLMLKLTQELFGNADPELNRTGAEVAPADVMDILHKVMMDMEAYFGEMTRKFREKPTDHVNSLIANATVNGAPITHRQMMGYYIIAATAGHDTTSNTLAAGCWMLAEHPEMLAQLQADPALLTGFVEETIRWSTPVKHFMRSATADTEIRGRKVAKGDWIMLSYHSANRDEEVFDRPFEFDMMRKGNKQIAFGSGPHVCLGQHLARLEMKVMWEELLPHLKSLELAGIAKLSQSNFVSGPKTVPIRFTAA